MVLWPRRSGTSRPASGPLMMRITAAAEVVVPGRAGAWATTATLKPEPIGASPMSRSGSSTTGSVDVGGATASVSVECAASPRSDEAGSVSATARARSSTVAVESAVTTMSTGDPA